MLIIEDVQGVLTLLMADLTTINITAEDLTQAYKSGFSDGSIVRDQTAVSGAYHNQLQRSFTALTLSNAQLQKDYDRLLAEHNRLADAVVTLQSIRDKHSAVGSVAQRIHGVLDALGEVSPF